MLEPYCGIGKVKKGKKRGNMKECVEKRQVRYYGLKKIDSKLLESVQNKSKTPNRKTLNINLVKIRATVKDLIKRIKDESEPDKRKTMKQEAQKLIQEVKDIEAQLKKINKK